MTDLPHQVFDPNVVAVVPVLISPLQVLIAILPGLVLALIGALLSLFKPRVLLNGLKLLWRLKVPLSGTVFLVLGLSWAARAIWPPSAARVDDAEDRTGDWVMFRGGIERRGATPGVEGPASGGVNWVWRQGAEEFLSSPAVVGNRVYVASATVGVFKQSGTIYCFDADSGAVAWQAAPSGYRPTFSSPVVSGHFLVCGEGLHVTSDARVICLDLRQGREGEVLWTYRTRSHVECTPIIHDGRVFIGAGDDGFYCFELKPDSNGNALLVWHVPGERYPDAETSLVVHRGKVYAGLGLGGRAICVLDADSGQELQRIPTPYPVFGPPAIADGKLYVGMGNGDYVNSAEEVRQQQLQRIRERNGGKPGAGEMPSDLGPAGEVWCVDLTTLRVDWKFHLDRTVLTAVVAAGDELYFGSRDGHLYSIGLDGKLIGRWNAHAPVIASPAATERYVYVVTTSGMLYGLDRRTLEPVWELAVSTKPLCVSSPVVARNRIYVGTQSDGFACAGVPRTDDVPPLWPGHLGGPGKAGNLDASPLPEQGAFHWQFPEDQAGETPVPYVVAPIAAVGEHVVVPLGGGPQHGAVCVPVKRDAEETPVPLWRYKTANPVKLSPAIAGDTVLIVDGARGQRYRHLHALGLRRGDRRWQVPVAPEATGDFIATAREVFVQDGEESLSSWDLRGHHQWSHRIGSGARAPAVTASMLVTVLAELPGAAKGTLVALDRLTGLELWRKRLEATPIGSPAVYKNVVYLGTGAGLEARSLIDGARLPGWRVGGSDVSAPFALSRKWIVHVSSSGELVVLSRENGSVIRRVRGALPGMAPLVRHDIVLYASSDAILTLQPAEPDSEPTQWVDTSWLGAPSTPMVLTGSKIYLGMAGWGLVCLGRSR